MSLPICNTIAPSVIPLTSHKKLAPVTICASRRKKPERLCSGSGITFFNEEEKPQTSQTLTDKE
ncbi:hypothetical protein FACS1894110_09510 [Spirochaetia bacterium]|nr:hypothetical protein FACS1894110_09510 [Spirochaetia bacterium]